MTDEYFAKVSKQGSALFIRIPAKDKENFESGDPVYIRVIKPKGDNNA